MSWWSLGGLTRAGALDPRVLEFSTVFLERTAHPRLLELTDLRVCSAWNAFGSLLGSRASN